MIDKPAGERKPLPTVDEAIRARSNELEPFKFKCPVKLPCELERDHAGDCRAAQPADGAPEQVRELLDRALHGNDSGWHSCIICGCPERGAHKSDCVVVKVLELVNEPADGVLREALERELKLLEMIRTMTFDKCPYCMGSSRNGHHPACPVRWEFEERALAVHRLPRLAALRDKLEVLATGMAQHIHIHSQHNCAWTDCKIAPCSELRALAAQPQEKRR